MWQMLCTITVIALCILSLVTSEVMNTARRQERSLTFPDTALYGLFIAIAVPVDIPEKNVFISYNFEANYGVPANSSEFADLNPLAFSTVAVRKARSLDRKTAYTILEDRLNQEGFLGKECLLRSICEAAETPLGHNGIIGGILHVILTPSSSVNEGINQDYYKAEKSGLNGDCQVYAAECPTGLIDIISNIKVTTDG